MRLSVFVVFVGLYLLHAPALLAAVVVLETHQQEALKRIDLIEARAAPVQSDSPLDAFSVARLATERGQVVLDHQRPLNLQFKEPLTAFAAEISDPRNQAMLALTLFRGEHEVGRQVFAHQSIHGSRVALIRDGRIALASVQDFDRIELRRIDSLQDAPALTVGALSLPDSSESFIKSAGLLASPNVASSSDPLACIVPFGIAYNLSFFYALVPAPSAEFAGSAAFYSNLALKFCDSYLKAPKDIKRNVPPGVCKIELAQPHMAFTYQNALGVPLASPSGWGQLGTPQVYHHNTSVDVLLMAGNNRPPAGQFTDLGYLLSSASFDASDKIWEDCRADGSERFSQLEGAGPEYECPYYRNRKLEFPVGATTVSWQASPRLSPVDLFGSMIPGLPPGAKGEPWTTLLVNVLRETVLVALDTGISGWRLPHTTYDFQTITIVDDIPPTIQPLPGSNGNASAELVDSILHVTIQADEFGGVSRRRYENILRSFLNVSDACNRPTTLGITFPDPALQSFWKVSTDAEDNSFEVTWTARDPGPNSAGVPNETTTTMHINVLDLQPPTIVPPPDIVEIDSTQVTDLGQPAVFDLVDLNPEVSHDATLPLDVGLHPVTWTATDFSGNSSSAVQIVNVKASNLPPVALAQTGPDRQHAVSFDPTPIRLHGSDPDGDPLRFKIEDRPENGFFVAPLYPYFIEDFRIERSITDAELLAICADDPFGSFHLDFPSEPEFLTVTDDGRAYVVDAGYIRCRANPSSVEREGRLVVFANDGTRLNAAVFPDDNWDLRDVLLDVSRDRVLLTTFRGSGNNSLLRVFDLDLQRIVVYDLQDLRSRSDGSCPALPNSGGSCNFLRVQSGVIDDNDLIYLMNGFGAIVVLDGTLPPGFVCEGNCSYRPKFVSVLDQHPENLPSAGSALRLDDQGRLYAARYSRIYRYTSSFVAAGDGLAYPGTFEGWMGRCDIDLAPGDQAVCDVTNQRSLGFSCTDSVCQVDDSNNQAACPDSGQTFQARSGCLPGQFFFTALGLDLAPDGTLYAADTLNNRIQRFSTDGFFAGQAKSTGAGSGFVIGDFGSPRNISVNSSRFYILDPATNLLHISLLTPFVEIGDDYADLVYQSTNQFACDNSADCIDRFSFSVSDGVRDPETGQPEVSPPADVQVEVSRNFRPPFATPGISVVVLEDTPTPVPLDGSDPDPLDTLSFEIVDPPSKGTVIIDGQDVTFVPDADAWGADSFSFRVNDGMFASATEIVHVEIIEINDAPIISQPDEILEGGTGFRLQLDLAFRDPDPDEKHSLLINWGDGTIQPGGGFDAQGNPTGPILSHSGTGSGRITAEHIYTSAGLKSIEVCVTDRVQSGAGGTLIPTPGLSLTSCEIIAAGITDRVDLALTAQPSPEVALPSQFVNFQFRVENRQPLAGAGLTATGIELGIRLASGFDPNSVNTPTGCVRTNLTLFCEVDDLTPGQFRHINVTAQVASSTVSGALLRTEAEAFLDQTPLRSDLSLRLHTPISRPADFQVGFSGDALRDKPDANPGDGVCASIDGVCTLRAAIEEAAASGMPKVIALANGTYVLDESLDIQSDVILIGNGPEQTQIHGAEISRAGSLNNLRLENLTISGSNLYLGGLGTLTVRRVRFSGNSNEFSFGGAILATNTTLDIRDSTFDNNTTPIDGGSLACNSCSGVMENVTVTGGSGGGLFFIGSGNVDLKHTTIVNTGGGSGWSSPAGGSLHVYGNMTVTLANSVLADNYGLSDHEAVNCAVGADASLISLGNNALGDLTGCTLTPQSSDILIDDASLLPLATGPDGLAVRLPRPDSPLVDAFFDTSCLPTDARGQLRPMDGNDDGVTRCDIGAVERRPVSLFRDGFEGGSP